MASGAILFRFTLKSAPTIGGSGPYVLQTFGLSTGDTDLTGIDIVGDGTACKFWTGYVEGFTYSNSLDLSKGNGGFASPIDGELTLIDATSNAGVSLSSAIRDGLVALEGATVWVAAIPDDGTFADVKKIVQLQVVGDPSVSGGDDPSIILHLRSPSWAASGALEATISRTQILDDPTDYENPGDPSYPLGDGFGQPFQSAAGVAFGGQEVSIKAGIPQPVQKLCRYDRTTGQAGDVGDVAGPVAFIASTYGTSSGPAGYDPDSGGAFGDIDFAAGLWFGCRTATTALSDPADLTEAQALYDLLELYQANGYRIVLTDGSWFLDISTQTHSGAPVKCPIPEAPGFARSAVGDLFSKGYAVAGSTAFPLGVTAPYAGVLFNLCDRDGNELFDSLPDATAVQILAVPASIPLCAEQIQCVGVAENGEIIPVSAELSVLDGVTFWSPACANQSGVTVPKALPLEVCADPQAATANRFGRAYMDPNPPTTSLISGSLNPINISAKATYTVGGPSATQTLSLKLRVGAVPPSLNIGMLDVSYRTLVKLNGRTGSFAFWGPYWKRADIYPTPVTNRSVRYKASSAPIAPTWKKAFRSLDDAYHETQLITKNNLTGANNTMQIEIDEAFLWDFREISFSALYPVVYPFALRFGFEQIAAAPSVVCGVNGTSEILVGAISGQTIAWASILPEVTTDSGTPAWTGIAYDGSGRFLAIGHLTEVETADDTMIFATSTDGGATWAASKDAFFPGYSGGKIYCDGVRWAVVVSGANYIRTQTVAGYPGAWTDSVTSRAFPAAKGNGSLWLVGGAVASGYNLATTTNFAALATQTVGTTEEIVSISWISTSKTWLVGMSDGSVWYCAVATDATVPAAWTKVQVFAGNLAVLGNWSGVSLEAFGFDADGRTHQMGTVDGVTWVERDSRPDVAIYHSVYSNPAGVGIWIGASGANQSGQIVTSDSVAATWTPWATPSPSTALQKMRSQRFGGVGAYDYNPLRWSGLPWDGLVDGVPSFGISFDPSAGATPSTAVAKICSEWWGFAGEFHGDVDASNDPIVEELPRVVPGDVEDVYSELTFQYDKFGAEYRKTAYIKNVDTAYSSGNDAFYFGGWDPAGENANGLAIWNECRASYLRYGTKRSLSASFDSIHNEATMGALWLYDHPDLGVRVRWITRQPRYLYLTVNGVFGSTQDIASLRATSGCRYKPNQTMLAAQDYALPDWGIVTSVEADPVSGEIRLEVAFSPE